MTWYILKYLFWTGLLTPAHVSTWAAGTRGIPRLDITLVCQHTQQLKAHFKGYARCMQQLYVVSCSCLPSLNQAWDSAHEMILTMGWIQFCSNTSSSHFIWLWEGSDFFLQASLPVLEHSPVLTISFSRGLGDCTGKRNVGKPHFTRGAPLLVHWI